MIKRIFRRFFKVIAVTTIVLIALLFGFHLWFINHAEKIVSQLVEKQSKGQLKANIGKLRISYTKLRIDLEKVHLYPADANSESARVSFSSSKMNLQVKSLWSAVFHKNIEIDSIICEKPIVEIYKHKAQEHKKISLPEEVGKIYLNIQHALNNLQIERFQINDGSLSIIDKTKESKPLKISDIFFTIDNLRIDSGTIDNQPFLFSDNIDLKIGKQDLTWENGNRQLQFNQLHLNTKADFLEIDDCFISRKRPDSAIGGSFTVFFDQLRLANPDLKALYLSGSVSADSVFCDSPVFKMEARLKDSIQQKKKSGKTFEQALQSLAGDIRLNHLDVKNADISIVLKKGNETKSFITSNNNFSFSDVEVRKHAEEPIFIGHINMSIKNYLSYSSDSAFKVSFDSVGFINNRVQLSNFAMTSLPNEKKKGKTSMKIASFEMDDVSWTELLFNKRIVARNAILRRPVISIESEKKQSAHKTSSIYEVIEHIGSMVELDDFRLADGEVNYKNKGGMSFQLKGVNAGVNTHHLLNAQSRGDMQQAISMFAFSQATINSRNLNMQIKDAHFEGKDESLAVRQLELKNNQGTLNVFAEGVHIKELLSDSALLQAEGISWQKATVKLTLLPRKERSGKMKLMLDLKDINANNTSVEFITSTSKITTQLETLNIPSFHNEKGIDVGIGAYLQGRNLQMSGASQLSLGSYAIKGRGSSVVSDIKFQRYSANDSLSATLNRIEFVPHIHEISTGIIEFEEIAVTKPVINYFNRHVDKQSTTSTDKKPLPKLNIGKVRIVNPIVHIDTEKEKSNRVIVPVPTAGSPETVIQLSSIKTTKEGVLNINDIVVKLQEFSVLGDSNTILCRREGNIDLQVQKAFYKPGHEHSKAAWGALMKNLDANYLLFDRNKKGKELHLVLKKAEMDSIWINSDRLKPQDILEGSKFASISKLSGNLHTSTTDLAWFNVEYDNYRKQVKIDSFEYSPAMSRDSFVAVAKFEPTYIKARVHNLTVHNVDLPAYFRDSVAKLKKIVINEPILTIYKDKTIPFNPGNVKPLPVNLIKSIPVPFSLDTLELKNGLIEYVERSKKTRLEGRVHLTRLNATLFPIRNYGINDSDSLSLKAQAYLMDTAQINLRMRESYTDSLAGFVMTVEMPKTNLTILNSIAEPTASVKLVSGQLDSLYMHAVGREYMSIGTMRMHYKKLRLQFLKEGKEGKKGLLTGFITFAANAIVKSNNSKRTGKIFFMRDRHRQVVNYWVKMAISGVATSVGVKHSKKYEKLYKRHLKQQNLPPINF